MQCMHRLYMSFVPLPLHPSSSQGSSYGPSYGSHKATRLSLSMVMSVMDAACLRGVQPRAASMSMSHMSVVSAIRSSSAGSSRLDSQLRKLFETGFEQDTWLVMDGDAGACAKCVRVPCPALLTLLQTCSWNHARFSPWSSQPMRTACLAASTSIVLGA